VERDTDSGLSPPPPRCERCGDVIGVYEPYALVDNDNVLVSSRVAEPVPHDRGRMYHLGCLPGS
jgi:hypothetical protein